MTSDIQQVSPNSTALNAENYQTFEMAKANDDVLASDDISQIRSYAAYARAQAQAIHKTIAATSGIEDVAAIKEEATETAQTFAKVGIYADQRIGEILRELPTKQGARNDITSVSTPTKVEAEKQANLDHHTAIDLQKMAANPEVVEAVIAKAEQDGRVVSRSQVLKAIKERDEAREKLDSTQREAKASHILGERIKAELDGTKEDLAEAMQAQEDAEAEVTMLKRKLESIEHSEPKVIEREVEVVREVVPEDVQKRINNLERENRRLNDEYQQMWRKKREADAKLDQANELLGEKERNDNAQRDIEHLTVATNTYLRNYGGKAWAFDQFYRVDEVTQREFVKAITNLAAFAQGIEQLISDKTNLEA